MRRRRCGPASVDVEPRFSFCCSLIRSPISESRRVLQESCEFFLKHNSRVQHKKKHHSPSSHKLKVISKSMGTSTGAVPLNAPAAAASILTNHGTSAVSNHDAPAQCSLSEASVREHPDRCTSGRNSRRGVRDGAGRQSKGGSSGKISSRSESTHRAPDVRYVGFLPHSPAVSSLLVFNRHSVRCSGRSRLTPKSEQHPALSPSHSSSAQDSAHQLEHGVREESQDVKNNHC